jgi:hypothetical protein
MDWKEQNPIIILEALGTGPINGYIWMKFTIKIILFPFIKYRQSQKYVQLNML